MPSVRAIPLYGKLPLRQLKVSHQDSPVGLAPPPGMDPWEKFLPEKYGARVPSCFSRGQLFAALWTVARQAPLSTGFSRQESWSELPWLLPGDLPDPETEPMSLLSPTSAGGFFTTSTT